MSAIEEEITRYFANELSADEARALRERVRDDDALRALYDRHAAILAAAAKGEVAQGEGARVWQALEEKLDAQARPAPARSTPRVWRWLPALAGVLLVAGVVLVVARPGPQVGIKGGIKGGTKGGGAKTLVADVDFDIFAIRKKEDGSFSTPRLVEAGGALSMDDYIQFRYRSGEGALKRLYLGAFLPGAKGAQPRILLYYPRPENPAPLPSVLRAKLEPVGRSIKLAARHRPGELLLFALFAEQAPALDVARSALVRALERGKDHFDKWPGKVALLRKTYRLGPEEASP